MAITDSCPCYSHYSGLPTSITGSFFPPPLTDEPPPPDPEQLIDVVLSLVNGDFDLAAGGDGTTPDNWTSTPSADDFIVDDGDKEIDPVSAPYSAMGRDIHACQGTSDSIDLLADGVPTAHIDTGTIHIRLNYKYASNKDQGAAGFNFLDSGSTLITQKLSSYNADTGQVWVDKEYRTYIPVGTRYVQVYLDLIRTKGDDLNANYDDLVVTIEALPYTTITTRSVSTEWTTAPVTIG